MNTLVKLLGGHSTLVKGISPSELHEEIEAARKAGNDFLFLQPGDVEDEAINGVCIDPNAVVALLRTTRDSAYSSLSDRGGASIEPRPRLRKILNG